jgi:8-oxo-dGTP diphosphatase
VVLAFNCDALRLLLISRAKNPFIGQWALPSGFLEQGETLDGCARRELQEETGVELRRLDQLVTFWVPGRDPRGDVISVAYRALVRADRRPLKASGDVSEAAWHDISALPRLAFDHERIVAAARQRLTDMLYTSTAAFDLLPDHFTLAEAQTAFEQVRDASIDKRDFRSWVHKEGLVRETGKEQRGQHRPAKLY